MGNYSFETITIQMYNNNNNIFIFWIEASKANKMRAHKLDCVTGPDFSSMIL